MIDRLVTWLRAPLPPQERWELLWLLLMALILLTLDTWPVLMATALLIPLTLFIVGTLRWK